MVWIRSQDRKILTATYQVYASLTGVVRAVIVGSGDTDVIGTYSTQERALQVLDKIQEHIKSPTWPTFEMPAE